MSGILTKEPGFAVDGWQVDVTVRVVLSAGEGQVICPVREGGGDAHPPAAAKGDRGDGGADRPEGGVAAGHSGVADGGDGVVGVGVGGDVGVGGGDVGVGGDRVCQPPLAEHACADAGGVDDDGDGGAGDGNCQVGLKDQACGDAGSPVVVADGDVPSAAFSTTGIPSGARGAGATGGPVHPGAGVALPTGPAKPLEGNGGTEVGERIKALTIAVQEIRSDLEARSSERELMPIFRHLIGILWNCWDFLHGRLASEPQTGARVALEGVMEDLRGLLQFHGFEFLCSPHRALFDPVTMRVPAGLPAGVSASALVVANCRRPGFRSGQRVLECELVDVMPAAAGPEKPVAGTRPPGMFL